MNDLAATERCVKCGLCLPHCPTFALTGNEADSPRGRISLMQMLEQQDVELSPGLFRHLDQCLLCGACEAMCPSNVPFSELMDSARAELEPRRKRSFTGQLARKTGYRLLVSPRGRRVARTLLATARALRLDRLLARLPGIPGETRRRLAMLPPHSGSLSPPPESDGGRGNLNLFTGCTGSLFDNQTQQAARSLLTRLGYRISIPEGQGCCGALHAHDGDPQTAARLAQANLNAFAANSDPIIGFSSACSAQLKTYARRYPDSDAFSRRTTDILQFLVERDRPPAFSALPRKVAVHLPCSHRYGLNQQSSVMQVLAWIPELQPVILNPDGGCCGAAGIYLLTQPELSQRLGAQLASAFEHTSADILLTTNIGCALQLRAATGTANTRPEILHPVTLLDRLLIDNRD